MLDGGSGNDRLEDDDSNSRLFGDDGGDRHSIRRKDTVVDSNRDFAARGQDERAVDRRRCGWCGGWRSSGGLICDNDCAAR
jgi:hypothetical protein